MPAAETSYPHAAALRWTYLTLIDAVQPKGAVEEARAWASAHNARVLGFGDWPLTSAHAIRFLAARWTQGELREDEVRAVLRTDQAVQTAHALRRLPYP